MLRYAIYAGWLVANLAGQTTFKTEVNLMSVNVRVTDSHGRDVTALDQSSFMLFEDGKEQRIAAFEAEAQPVSLGVLLDISRSMVAGGKLTHAKAALSALIASGHSANEIFFMEFADRLGDVIELTNHRQLPIAVSQAVATRSGTALYDAVAVALCRLRNAQHPRRALIVLTDGADQHSRLGLEQLIRIVRSSDAQVYIIGDFTAEENEIYGLRHESVTLVSGRSIDNPIVAFERLARESGAESYFPVTPAQLKRAVEAVAKELKTQYTLSYYPETSMKPYRRIEVRLPGQRFKVQARHGFSTIDPGIHFRLDKCSISTEDHPYPYESKLSRKDGRLVYHEDFSDPTSGWPIRDLSWYGTGNYHVVGKDGAGSTGEATISAYGPWWNNFRASTFVQLSMAPPRNAAMTVLPASGLVFRLNDRGFYALLISNLGSGRRIYGKLITKEFRGPSIDLIPWTSVVNANQGQAGGWKSLAVDCRDSLIVASINGREFGRVKDPRFLSGHAGMAQFGSGHAVFRDLLIEE